MGLAERIFAAIDLPLKSVGVVSEWGIEDGELFQRGMTGQERREFESLFVRDETGELPDGDPRSMVVGQTLVDASGVRVFTDEQIVQLSSKSGAVLDRLYDGAMRLSGIRASTEDERADLKNSEKTSGNGFATD